MLYSVGSQNQDVYSLEGGREGGRDEIKFGVAQYKQLIHSREKEGIKTN